MIRLLRWVKLHSFCTSNDVKCPLVLRKRGMDLRMLRSSRCWVSFGGRPELCFLLSSRTFPLNGIAAHSYKADLEYRCFHLSIRFFPRIFMSWYISCIFTPWVGSTFFRVRVAAVGFFASLQALFVCSGPGPGRSSRLLLYRHCLFVYSGPGRNSRFLLLYRHCLFVCF